MIRYFTALILILVAHLSHAQYGQPSSFREQLQFAEHLQNTAQYEELILHYQHLTKQKGYSEAQQDSLFWGLGLAFFNQKILDSSAFYLQKIQPENPLYAQAHLLAGVDFAYQNQHTQATATIREVEKHSTDSLVLALAQVEKSGVALLQRDFKKYDSLQQNSWAGQFYATSEPHESLEKSKLALQKVKKRSPLVAGLMSAIIPGSGKIYAGKRGQGISSLLQCVALGLPTYESYRKAGVKSARFIIYGSLFTAVYIGNIWGSSLSVQIKQQEMYDKIDNQLLFDMRIPLRNVFNY
ncbi:hypothetical protein SAMN05421780_110110 [Flexibacter flexilis DSM 6793]|uniref:Tetratricopeptide repeat-containing protein n=1 Tax=Flexibacter flexilis DSM 6793 TaxID=927664 RepID=A0A1I1MB21_9BACT|nr:hypothetical protein [Flexibacter flexilis]SFC82564.1 hypothetical protein SAMN05421780_110110 [Flexibacter flexilis DSM 6793]